MSGQAVVARGKAEAASNVGNGNDPALEVDHPERDRRGLREGRHGDHRQDPLPRRQRKGIALPLEEEDDELGLGTLNGGVHGATSYHQTGPSLSALLYQGRSACMTRRIAGSKSVYRVALETKSSAPAASAASR